MHRLIFGLSLLAAGAAGMAPASAAAACGPLKMVASTDLVERERNQFMVPVVINGTPTHFLVDTGGVFTQISPRMASALKLQFEAGATRVFDVSGNASGAYVKVDTMTMGGMTGRNVYLRVLPTNMLADGIVAPDTMKRFDVEMDFAGQKMNYFLPDHCFGKVVYWPHGDVAQISINLADQAWIKVPVTIDGKSFLAIIDTGATGTIISTDTAKEEFGLDASSPGMEPAGNINNDPNLASHRYRFSTLTLDGITVKNPSILIMPDRLTDAFAKSGQRMRKKAALPEVTLGMNVLKHLHLYFAFAEHRLYVTAGSAPAPATEAAPATAAAETPR